MLVCVERFLLAIGTVQKAETTSSASLELITAESLNLYNLWLMTPSTGAELVVSTFPMIILLI